MAMTDYEFHIGGLIGPVIQSALPELTITAETRFTVLTGTANDPAKFDELLGRLDHAGLITTCIFIATRPGAEPARIDR